MPSRVTKAVVVLVAALVAAPAVASAQSVSVYLTTHNQKKRMKQQASVAFAPAAAGANSVTVDDTTAYQEIEGFGASMTDSSAYLLNRVAKPDARDAAMRLLFSREDGGIGLGFVRNPMGASDLARTHYSFDDLDRGETDPTLAKFSVAHDQQDIIPLLVTARTLNPSLKIMASPWSAPGWMKTSGSLVGGTLMPSAYAVFADYFVKYLKAYDAAGLHVDYVSLQNEPLYSPADYPGTAMDAEQQRTVLRDFVLPAFAANGITSRVLVYDHNWDRPDYPETVLGDATVAASPLVAGVAWHGYGGGPGAQAEVAERFPSFNTYVTENSGGTWVTDQVRTDFETIVQSMRNASRSYVKWGLALDESRGPHKGGCSTCSPLVTVNSKSGAVTTTIDFTTLAHFSRFTLPGARRVYSSNAAGIVSVAFLNPDGSHALVAFNETAKKQTFQVRWGDRSFSYKLAGLSGVTFVWSGAQSGDVSVDATSRLAASSFTSARGVRTEITADDLGGFDVGFADDGDHLAFDDVDFASAPTAVDVRVASGGNGGTLELRLDAVDGPIVSTVTIPVTGGWQNWKTVSAPVAGATGKHALYAVFRGTIDVGNVNWLQFR